MKIDRPLLHCTTVAALLWCGTAKAEETTPRLEHVLTATFTQHNALASLAASPRYGPSLGWSLSLGHVVVGAGVRWGLPAAGATVPFEVYVRAALTMRLGAWAPLVGPELGLSGLTPPPSRSPQFSEILEPLHGPFYVAVHSELLRFRFKRWLVSAMGVDFGTNLASPGAALRVQFDFITVGFTL